MIEEKPILFCTDMVQAVLEERKTKTRRVVKPQFTGCDHKSFDVDHIRNAPEHNYRQCSTGENDFHCYTCGEPIIPVRGRLNAVHGLISPYGVPGDRLWVRETFTVPPEYFGYMKPSEFPEGIDFIYKERSPGYRNAELGTKWIPSIFMPRWASRILLEVTDVTVERLQDITTAEIQAEGVQIPCTEDGRPLLNITAKPGPCDYLTKPMPTCGYTADELWRAHWCALWDSINGNPRADGADISWAANPWVWAVGFKVLEVKGR